MKFWSNLIYLGVPILNFMRREALEGLEKDAIEVDFTSQLSKLQIPVAVFMGRNKEARILSDLPDACLRRYTQALPSCEVIEFCQSGHMIPDEEQPKYIAEVAEFIKRRSPRDR